MSYVRSLIASIRVGWSRDFGWTNPILGFSLKTVAPIASTMTALTILYIGFKNGASIASAQFPFQLGYIVIGATLYAHISAYSWVPTLAIAEGKWTFVFPQVYVSTKSSPPYLAGRCVASFASSTIRVAGRGRCNLITPVRSCDPSRGHTPLDLPVRNRSRREHIRFNGTGVLAGSIRHLCLKIRVGTANLRLGSSDGFL